jgi:uncharacterized protein YutE (UPF0331/DUF86 family)
MKDVDPIRIRDMAGHLADAVRRLRELGQLSEEDFLADFRNTESAKYLFIVAIESAIDICNHVVARQGGRAPQDYADCFTVLTDLGIVDSKLTGRLRQMARFRNLLVHVYTRVDNSQVYQILQEDLTDLDTFRRQILAWLKA